MSLRSYIEDYFSLGDLYLFCAFVIVVTVIGFELDIPSAVIEAVHSRDRHQVSGDRSSVPARQGMHLSVDGVASGQAGRSTYAQSALLDAHDQLLRTLRSDAGASREAFRHKFSSALDASRSATRRLVEDLRVQLDGEQARSQTLETELLKTRSEIAQRARFSSSPDATAMSMQASSPARQTELQAKDEQIAAMITERVTAQQAAAAQVTALQDRLQRATAQLSSSDHDLAALRERMAQAVQQKAADQAAADEKERSRQEVLSRQTADSSSKLQVAQQAAAAQVTALQDRLQHATAQLSSSDHDVAALRDQMTQAAQQKAADQAAADEKERSRQDVLNRQVSDSSSKLQVAQQAAAAQVTALQDRLQRATAQLSSSDHDLAALREQVAQAVRQKAADQAAADEKERSRQDVLNRQSADSSSKLKDAQQAAAAQMADLTARLSTAQSRSDNLDRDLAAARKQLAQAGQDKNDREAAQDLKGKIADLQVRLDAAEARSTAFSRSLADARAAGESGPAPKTTEATGPVKEAAMPPTGPVQEAHPQSQTEPLPVALAPPPANVPARVTLRYARNSETARGKAAALRLDLQSKGLAVADPVAAPKGNFAISVTYFYSEDREAAASLASLVSASGPVQRRLRAEDPLPPPGTVEVDFGS